MNAAPKPLAKSLRREQMAWRAAQDLPDGGLVNLGIGIPVLTSDYIPAGREVVLQSENGVVGVGPLAAPEAADPDLVDAGSRRIPLGREPHILDSTASFARNRGRHIDVSHLDTIEVAVNGDSTNLNIRAPLLRSE